jgi:hypothetical protein
MLAVTVMPVAPIHPPISPTPTAEPSPSVINMVGKAHKSNVGEGVYTSLSDPAKPGSEAATIPKDWTIRRPAPEKVEDPPPVPMSKVLMDQVKSLWQASASAVQVQQVKNQLDMSQPVPNANPGVLATEVFTYSPTKINKTEKT